MRTICVIFLITINSSVSAQVKYTHDSLRVKDGYIHFYVKGKGEPILFMPGGPGFSHYYLRGITDSLTNYQSILIDFYGTGRSQYKKPDSTWVNQYNMVNDAELLRKHLKIKSWIVFGQSWASHTAMLYGIKHPQATKKIILQATPGTDNRFQRFYADNLNMRFTQADKDDLAKVRSNPDAGRFDGFTILFRRYFYDKSKAPLFFKMPKEEEPYFFNDNFFEAFRNDPGYDSFDIAKEVYALDIPIRIVQGRQDPANGGEQERLNERSKNSKIIYIERAGHFPWLEQPYDFFKALRESLKN